MSEERLRKTPIPEEWFKAPIATPVDKFTYMRMVKTNPFNTHPDYDIFRVGGLHLLSEHPFFDEQHKLTALIM